MQRLVDQGRAVAIGSPPLHAVLDPVLESGVVWAALVGASLACWGPRLAARGCDGGRCSSHRWWQHCRGRSSSRSFGAATVWSHRSAPDPSTGASSRASTTCGPSWVATPTTSPRRRYTSRVTPRNRRRPLAAARGRSVESVVGGAPLRRCRRLRRPRGAGRDARRRRRNLGSPGGAVRRARADGHLDRNQRRRPLPGPRDVRGNAGDRGQWPAPIVAATSRPWPVACCWACAPISPTGWCSSGWCRSPSPSTGAGSGCWLLAALGAACVVVGWTAAGFWWIDGFLATRARYLAGVSSRRPMLVFLVANLSALALATGPAVGGRSGSSP